jgi:hypothetical protein
MVKIISCRVVRSKPLGKSSDTLRHASKLNNTHYKTGDIFSGIPQGKYAGNPITYTRLTKITSVSVDNVLTGRILDCYV